MGIEAGGFQSGFVIAVVIAALLLADRLGGVSTMALRGAQLALALALVMLVLGATATVAGPFEPNFDPFEPSEAEVAEAGADYAERSSVTGTVHIAAAIAFVALGVALLRKRGALAPGILLAGVLLLIGAPDAWPGAAGQWSYAAFFPFAPGLGDAGDARNVARLLVLAAGVVLLAVTIHLRWERGSGDSGAETEDSGAAAP